MKTTLTALLLTAGLTGCMSKDERLVAKGCDCYADNDTEVAARECLLEMAEEYPKLKENSYYGMKIQRMIKEKCPEAVNKAK